MIKKLLILGAFCSLSFAGISDDIAKGNPIDPKVEEINEFINDMDLECKSLNYYYAKADDDIISVEKLEKWYDSADSANINIRIINKKYKEKISKFYYSYDYKSFGKIISLLDDDSHWTKYQMHTLHKSELENICPEINSISEYKEKLKTIYPEVKESEEKAKRDEEELRIRVQEKQDEEIRQAKYNQEKTQNEAEIKQIEENEMFNWSKHRDTATIEEYDKYLSNANNLFEKLRQLSKPYDIDVYKYEKDAEERYINNVKDYRQRRIDENEREIKNKQQEKEYAEKAKQVEKALENDDCSKISKKFKSWRLCCRWDCLES